MQTTTRAARFLGTTDEVDACDCCGRQNLKSTVALVLDGEDREVYFGVTCAARALRVSPKDVRAGAKRADEEREAAEIAKREDERTAQNAVWFAWLDAKAPTLRADPFRQLQSLGGYGVARAAFKAEQAAKVAS